MIERIAVICVDCSEEVDVFYGWLKRNRRHIVGISENRGCGCCVDCFHIIVDDKAESMPGDAGGSFESNAVRFGSDRDLLLEELLS